MTIFIHPLWFLFLIMDDKWHTMIGVMASKKNSTNMFDSILKGVLFIYLLINFKDFLFLF